jgi:YHS domain-containing protein
MKLGVLLVFLATAVPVFGQGNGLRNLDKNGLAIQGYDPVAFFTQNKPVKGRPEFESKYNGARYLFVSSEDKATFDANPMKYEPQFGGFCAYGVSKGHIVPVKIEAFQIVNGRLLMQYDLDIRGEFNKDTQGNLQKADKNWPGLVESSGNKMAGKK